LISQIERGSLAVRAAIAVGGDLIGRDRAVGFRMRWR
jgi:hypothetical protein